MSLFRDKYKDASDEFAWHLEQRTQSLIRQGFSPADAAIEARKRIGNIGSLAEQTAESDSFMWLETLKRDFILAMRMLRRAPSITAIAILSLALGIGANTAVFTLMKQVVLDYLPVASPERLVILHNVGAEEGHTYSNGMNSSFSYPLYKDLNAATQRIFDGILAFRNINVSLSGQQATETIKGGLVSGNFFQVLQVSPWRGRLFDPGDDQKPNGSAVAVIGYGLWQRTFGGDANVVGRTILVNKHPYVVVGITPPQFYGIDVSNRADLYVPLSMKADVVPDQHLLTERLDHWANLIGRLKPDVNVKQASAALSAIYPPLRDQDLAFMKSPSPGFRHQFNQKYIQLADGGKGYASLRDDLGNPLKILMAMVAIVLLITIVNVANLLIARGIARQRDMAIRLAVGAGKGNLIRQLLMESLVLAGAGGLLGVALAYAATPAVLHALSFDLSSASISAHPDWRVLLFAAAITLTAGLLFGLLPAWQSARTDVGAALKSEGSFGNTGNVGWIRRGLVVSQFALSLVLLSSAILFARSLGNLKNINVGFDTNQLVKFELNPLQAGYSQARIKSFGEQMRLKLDTLPEVENASLATIPLLEDSDEGGDITVEGFHTSGDVKSAYDMNSVGPEFFSTLKIPLMAGRAFSSSDTTVSSAGGAAIVNQTFVKSYLAGRNPLGARFGFGSGNAVVMSQTIVGVVADSQHSTTRSKIIPFVFLPYLADQHLHSLTYYVRIKPPTDERSMGPAIRGLVHQLDASLSVARFSSVNEVVNESLFVERSLGYLSVGFAILATLLSVIGLFGVMSYSVTSRKRELGIRMAIGATPQRVLRMILRETAYLVVFGVLCGIPLLLAITSYIRSSLYGVQPNDPLVWCAAVLLLISVALLAGLIPALQASKLNPHSTLRSA